MGHPSHFARAKSNLRAPHWPIAAETGGEGGAIQRQKGCKDGLTNAVRGGKGKKKEPCSARAVLLDR